MIIDIRIKYLFTINTFFGTRLFSALKLTYHHLYFDREETRRSTTRTCGRNDRTLHYTRVSRRTEAQGWQWWGTGGEAGGGGVGGRRRRCVRDRGREQTECHKSHVNSVCLICKHNAGRFYYPLRVTRGYAVYVLPSGHLCTLRSSFATTASSTAVQDIPKYALSMLRVMNNQTCDNSTDVVKWVANFYRSIVLYTR